MQWLKPQSYTASSAGVCDAVRHCLTQAGNTAWCAFDLMTQPSLLASRLPHDSCNVTDMRLEPCRFDRPCSRARSVVDHPIADARVGRAGPGGGDEGGRQRGSRTAGRCVPAATRKFGPEKGAWTRSQSRRQLSMQLSLPAQPPSHSDLTSPLVFAYDDVASVRQAQADLTGTLTLELLCCVGKASAQRQSAGAQQHARQGAG